MFGIGLFAADGTCVYGTNTDLEDFVPRRLEGDAEVRLSLEGLRLVEGTYLLDLAAHKRDGTPYDYQRGPALVPGQEPGQGRRGLPPAAPVVVQRRRRARPARETRRAGVVGVPTRFRPKATPGDMLFPLLS